MKITEIRAAVQSAGRSRTPIIDFSLMACPMAVWGAVAEIEEEPLYRFLEGLELGGNESYPNALQRVGGFEAKQELYRIMEPLGRG